MHVALVERLAPRPGEQWLDLGLRRRRRRVPRRARGRGRDRLRSLAGARRDGAAPRGGARPRPHARGGRLPEPSLRRRVVRRRLVVGRRDLRARPRARCPRARPRLPARWPPRPDRLAQGERRRPDVRRDAAVHADPAAGRRLAVPVGRRGVRRVDARRRVRPQLRGARFAPRRATTPARCGRSSATTTARRSRSGRRSTTSSARARRGHDGVLRG